MWGCSGRLPQVNQQQSQGTVRTAQSAEWGSPVQRGGLLCLVLQMKCYWNTTTPCLYCLLSQAVLSCCDGDNVRGVSYWGWPRSGRKARGTEI